MQDIILELLKLGLFIIAVFIMLFIMYFVDLTNFKRCNDNDFKMNYCKYYKNY